MPLSRRQLLPRSLVLLGLGAAYAVAYAPAPQLPWLPPGALSIVPLALAGWLLGLAIFGLHQALAAGAPPRLSPASLITGTYIRVGVSIGHIRQLLDTRALSGRSLRDETSQYEALLRAHDDLGEIVIISEGQPGAERTVFFNDALCRITGYSREEITGMGSVWQLVPPEDRAVLSASLTTDGRSSAFETVMIAKDGRGINIEASLTRVREDAKGRGVTIGRDISLRKAAERELEQLALEDTLTGLPNRNRFHDGLERAIASARRNLTPMSLLVIDLDDFKEVNDTFGHEIGDRLLKEIGARLKRELRGADGAARLGGDEFAIMLPGTDGAEATVVARRVWEAINRPTEIEGQTLSVGASIGIAVYPEHGQDASSLLRRSDIAMYSAKRMGGGNAVYSGEQDNDGARRLALIADLRYALERDELRIHYQPLKQFASGRVAGVEALIRWQHPQRGLIAPGEFVAIAEKMGLMDAITEWVLDRSIAQAKRWRTSGLEVPVSVNISMRNLRDVELPDTISGLLRKHGADAGLLKVEITESDIMLNPRHVMHALERLRALGIRIAIDDFGTGYSSLAYLNLLPVDQLKIDRSLVKEICTDEGTAAIVRATIDLGHSLGLEIVGEGVEDQQTSDRLAGLGCDLEQGYYFGRPMAVEDLERWFTRTGAASAGRASAPAARPRAAVSVVSPTALATM